MDNTRRGFISNASSLGLGVFAYGVAQSSLAAGGAAIGSGDILLAMPGSVYYAIPSSVAKQYAVSEEAFLAEETLRAGSSGFSSRDGGGGTAIMGVRG